MSKEWIYLFYHWDSKALFQKRNADARQCSQYVSEQMRVSVLYLHMTCCKHARGHKCKAKRWPTKQGQQVCRLCWQIVLLQSQCSEVSNIQCTARLWSAHEDSFSSHFWGNDYFSIIKWINKRTKQKFYFTILEAVSQLSTACFPSVYPWTWRSSLLPIMTEKRSNGKTQKIKDSNSRTVREIKYKRFACSWQTWISFPLNLRKKEKTLTINFYST